MEKESKQTEATMEQFSEELEATPQVTSPAEKAPSERPRTEEEFTKMQSMKDKAEAESQKKDKLIQSVQSELQELRKFNEQQRSEARRKEITDLEGDPDGQTSARRKHQLEDDVRRLEEQRVEEEGAVQRKYDQASDLAKQHNLSLSDARELLDAKSPREMELMAQLKVAEQGKGAKPSPEPSDFTPDSGISDVGDKRDWTRQEISDMSVEDYAKIKDKIMKAQREGRIK